jgi:hypothetical protein
MQNSSKFIKTLLITLALTLTASGCSLKKSANTTQNSPITAAASSNDFINQDSTTVQTKTLADLAKAQAAATAWKSDAVFYAYNFKVPPDFSLTQLEQTFVFGSLQEPDYWWTYTLDSQGKVVRAFIYKEDYLGKDLQPISEQYWKISYPVALQIAEANGGLAFRSQNPETLVTLTLEQTQPKNYLWYIIVYQAAKNSKTIRISALDGKIYDDQGNIVTTTSQ